MRKRISSIPAITPEMKVLISVEEAAAMLSLGRTLVYQLVMRGELRSIKIGSTRRVIASSLQEYIGRQIARAS
jgi:excisionase family DNA binding protein